MAYPTRHDAGLALAAALREAHPDLVGGDAVVLGVPRGGVVVAAAVARQLGLPLDVALARKLGAPFNPELAIGAIAEGGGMWVNRALVDRLGISEAWLEEVQEREGRELARRGERYRRGPRPLLTGKVLVVVDDGVATGATLVAVLQALRTAQPRLLICAVPVAPPAAVTMLAEYCDTVVCPLQPRRFEAVGAWFDDFSQTTDDEVLALLGAAHRPENRQDPPG